MNIKMVSASIANGMSHPRTCRAKTRRQLLQITNTFTTSFISRTNRGLQPQQSNDPSKRATAWSLRYSSDYGRHNRLYDRRHDHQSYPQSEQRGGNNHQQQSGIKTKRHNCLLQTVRRRPWFGSLVQFLTSLLPVALRRHSESPEQSQPGCSGRGRVSGS